MGEGHLDGWEDLYGQGGEGINTNILSPPTPYLPAVRYTLSCGETYFWWIYDPPLEWDCLALLSLFSRSRHTVGIVKQAV